MTGIPMWKPDHESSDFVCCWNHVTIDAYAAVIGEMTPSPLREADKRAESNFHHYYGALLVDGDVAEVIVPYGTAIKETKTRMGEWLRANTMPSSTVDFECSPERAVRLVLSRDPPLKTTDSESEAGA